MLREPKHTIGSNSKRNATIHCAPAGTSTSEGVKSISREVAGSPGMADESTRLGREKIGERLAGVTSTCVQA